MRSSWKWGRRANPSFQTTALDAAGRIPGGRHGLRDHYEAACIAIEAGVSKDQNAVLRAGGAAYAVQDSKFVEPKGVLDRVGRVALERPDLYQVWFVVLLSPPFPRCAHVVTDQRTLDQAVLSSKDLLSHLQSGRARSRTRRTHLVYPQVLVDQAGERHVFNNRSCELTFLAVTSSALTPRRGTNIRPNSTSQERQTTFSILDASVCKSQPRYDLQPRWASSGSSADLAPRNSPLATSRMRLAAFSWKLSQPLR